MQPTIQHASIADTRAEEAPRGLSRILGAGLFMLLLAAVLVVSMLLRTTPL
jgi:hypothetical protein